METYRAVGGASGGLTDEPYRSSRTYGTPSAAGAPSR